MVFLISLTHKVKPIAAVQNMDIAAQRTSTGMPVHHSGAKALCRQILL